MATFHRPARLPRRGATQRRAKLTVNSILAAAEALFSRRGVQRTTTNAIARSAGVSIGTLYHYFPSKEALAEALVHDLWEREARIFEAHGDLVEREPLEVAVGALFHALADHVRRHARLYACWLDEAPELGDRDYDRDLRRRTIAHLANALAKSGKVQRAKSHVAAQLVITFSVSLLRDATRYETAHVDVQLAEVVIPMLADGLHRLG